MWFDIRPHHCHRWMVQSYSPGCANVPSHMGALAPPGKYDWTSASFGPRESTTQTANRLVQPFLHSSRQKVPILCNGWPLPQDCSFSWGGIWTPSNSWFLVPFWAHNPNSITTGWAVFAQMTTECPYALQRPFPLSKLPLSMGASGRHLIHGSLSPPESSSQMASRSVQTFLQGSLGWQTDRQTDRQTTLLGW